MPAYPWMLTKQADFESIPTVMRAHQIIGVPYTDDEVAGGEAAAREQAQMIAEEIVEQGGPDGLADKEIVALIAYLQRLGTDITKPEPVAIEEEIGPADQQPAAEAAAEEMAEATDGDATEEPS
jgi:cytochrome c oxidase cbb3-type subunit I/II